MKFSRCSKPALAASALLALVMSSALIQGSGAVASVERTAPHLDAVEVGVSPSATPQGARLISKRRVPFKVWGQQLAGAWLRDYEGGLGGVVAWNALTGRKISWRSPWCASKGGWSRGQFMADFVGERLIGYATCTKPKSQRKTLRVSVFDLGKQRLTWSRQVSVSGESSYLRDSNDKWLVFQNSRDRSPRTTDVLTFNLQTGEPGGLTLRDLKPAEGTTRLNSYSAVEGDVLAFNAIFEPISGWSIATGKKLWTVAAPGYPDVVPVSLYNVAVGVPGAIVIDVFDKLRYEALDPRSGNVVAGRLPAFTFIDRFRPIAASADTVLDTSTWQVLWRLEDASIVAMCAGRVWDSTGTVRSAATGEVLARGEKRAPSACLSPVRTAYMSGVGGSDWVEVYEYPSPP